MNAGVDTGPRAAAVDTLLAATGLDTPAFVYDETTLADAAALLAARCRSAGCTPLFSLKAIGLAGVLPALVPPLAGVSVASLFEARSARAALGRAAALHLATPGLRAAEMAELGALCRHVVYNSLSQFARLSPMLPERTRVGLRVNPGLSLVADPRFDPCRPHSKLGVPLARLAQTPTADLRRVSGLHLHSNCEGEDYAPLLATVRHLHERAPHLLDHADWINLGGGYEVPGDADDTPLVEAVALLRERHGLQVLVEPGAALVRDAGYIVASVIDLFDSGGRAVAVLDTSVNHMPEVFEYGFEPEVAGDDAEAPHEYELAGCTCLAGDRFGLYGFDQPLGVGSRLVFCEAGAYTYAKAHVFNGVALPTVYALTRDGALRMEHRFDYEQYQQQFGGEERAAQ